MDKYEPLLIRYSEYCLSFLHLTPIVTEAAIREVRLFLEKNVSNPDDIEWKTITAKDIISFLSKERSSLSIGSIGVSVTAIRRFFRFLMHNDYDIHLSVLDLPLSVPNFEGNEKKYVDEALDQGWVSTGGAYITKLEKDLAVLDTELGKSETWQDHQYGMGVQARHDALKQELDGKYDEWTLLSEEAE